MYIPNASTETVRTLAEWGAFFNSQGKPNDVIELLDQENSILDDIKWKEATDYDGNRTALREKLPAVYWRKLYKGIDVSKSMVTMVKDPVGMLEARSMIDAKLLAIHGSQQKNYRMSEARAFMESMRTELATAVFYGDIKGNPEGIHGLSPRYTFSNAPNVIDAGGKGMECTSIWGVVWGENEVTGIFPKDSKAGLTHRDLGESDVYDDEGLAFRAVQDLYEWNVGLSVRDWRCAVRICNIPVASLYASKGEEGFVDLHRLSIQAKNLIPQEKRQRMVWYVNTPVMTALELQASDAGNVHLHYGDLFRSKNIPFLHQCGVRQCDAILTTEEALAKAPAN